MTTTAAAAAATTAAAAATASAAATAAARAKRGAGQYKCRLCGVFSNHIVTGHATALSSLFGLASDSSAVRGSVKQSIVDKKRLPGELCTAENFDTQECSRVGARTATKGRPRW
eukprot:TRINITY_DN3628_c0_g1_i1.p4 TRINITY_DN3628_c0_g1~~TRINITY_DN3628_c0_g1_i1.p4  ORF type:complete len:114 (+),score=13.39 TRINITY_DN3628_c0_g1_i1:144-485(+)